MRSSLLVLFMFIVVSTPLRAASKQTALLGIQENCVAAGDISFGPRWRWADCQVSRGRWVSTIDLIDMYQAQYCLGDGDGTCRKRALLLFGNRAYTPTATLMLQRQDPGGTEYDDPQVVVNEFGRILTVTAHLPGGRASSDYYLWQSGRWVHLDARHWLKDLPRHLPPGVKPGRVSLPDVDTMSATVSLLRDTDAGCCHEGEQASVELRLRQQRFALKKVKFANP